MQLFGPHENAKESARELSLVHVASQLRESTQILYTVWHLLGVPITASFDLDGKRVRPYEPFATNHPLVHWAKAAWAHYFWVLEHADELAVQYKSEYGHDHKCKHHVAHIRRQLLESRERRAAMPIDIRVHEWLATLTEKQREKWETRCARVNAPQGCDFGILVMAEEHRVVHDDGERDWTASYKNLCAHNPTRASVTRLGFVGQKRKRGVRGA